MAEPTDTFEPVFPEAATASHMPFLRSETLLFCLAHAPQEHKFERAGTVWSRVDRDRAMRAHFADVPRSSAITFRRWKLWMADWHSRATKKLATGLPEASVECCPSFYVDNGVFNVSFVGGIITARVIEYSLYQMSGPSLESLGPASVVASGLRAGFVSHRYICVASGNAILLQDRHAGQQVQLVCPAGTIHSINYRADNESTLIVTCQPLGGPDTTLVYDIDNGDNYSFQEPSDVYKPTIAGDHLIFARRRGKSSDDFELQYGKYEMTRPSIQMQRVASNPKARLLARALSGRT